MVDKYPLQEVLNIKKKRLDEAIRLLEEKKRILEQEVTKLKELETERDTVLKHKNDKLTQLRNALDEGSDTLKIRDIKRYLETVNDKLLEKQKKVNVQKEKVIEAETQVEIAKQDLIKKQKKVEKLNIHKKEWEKEQTIIERRKEEVKHDELGSTIHELKKRKKTQKKK